MRVIGNGSKSVIIHHNGDNIEVWYNYGQDPYLIVKEWRDTPVEVWGQRTFKKTPSVFDRVGVRGLLLTIKEAMNNTLSYCVGDFNDVVTRRKVRSYMDQYLANIATVGVIQNKWRVICDETNNGPEVIIKNKLHMDIIIQPTKSNEFINLNGVLSMKNTSLVTTENSVVITTEN